MKKYFVIALIINVLVLSACVDTPSNESTTLKIINRTSYILYNVEYSSVEFNDIEEGKDKTMIVSDNSLNPIYFDLNVNNNRIRCRTVQLFSYDKGSVNERPIINNDPIITVTGGITGTISSVYNTLSKPILEFSQNNNVITNNYPTAFNFGEVELNNNVQRIFTIKNNGNLPLELNGSPIISSSNSVFTIPSQPINTTIAPGASIAFIIQYTPNAEKDDTGVITIFNNSDDLFYTLNVRGTGFISMPQITVRQGAATTIPQSGEFNFGPVFTGENRDVIFTIGNTGQANLTFETINDKRINLENNAGNHFTVTTQPSSATSIAPGSTTTFTIRFAPVTVGSDFNAVVKIKTNSRNYDEFLFTIKGSSLLASPVGVTALFQEPNSIHLSWNPVMGATNYNVYFGTNSSSITVLAGTVTENSYTHTGLAAGITYFYYIIAQDGTSESVRSQVVSAITLPDIPNNFRSTASTQNSITLAWNAVTGAASYRVYSAASATGNKTQIGTVNSGTTYSHTGLPASTTHYYFVTAVNSAGEGAFTEALSVRTLLATPAGVTAVFQAPNSIVVSWNPLNGASSYKVYFGTSSSTINVLASSAVTGTSYTHTGLTAGTTYFYNIIAQDDTGESERSQTVSRITSPGIPANLRSTASTHNSVNVAWNAVTGASTYNIYFAATLTGSKTLAGSSNTTSYNHTNLTANTTRYYFITAVNASGESTFSEALTLRTLIAPLSAPTNVTATAQTTNSIRVTWGAVTGATGYRIYRSTTATGTRTLLDTVNTTTYTSGGLEARTYWYFVAAMNADNVEGTLSAFASMIPLPNAPSNVRSSPINSTTNVQINWNDVTGADSYRIYVATSQTGTRTLAGTSTWGGFTHTGAANTTYFYFVTAFNAAGESALSLHTSTRSMPAAPANLRATATTTTTITLAWNSVPGAAAYHVIGFTQNNIQWWNWGGTGTTVTLTGATPQTWYYFEVDSHAHATEDLYGPQSVGIWVQTR
ncbi:MAG: fibronectin type III domain-containing protein [Treponema sp.]|nr:fibronectin type III domain-containing protein [Treponema sp.]